VAHCCLGTSMSITQTIARNLLSDRLFASLQAESQSWVMTCPCGAETSIWDMGGIRWKAAGQPRRMGRCGTCSRTFVGILERQESGNHHHLMNASVGRPIDLEQTGVVLLWVDGVGSWMLFPQSQITLGGPVEPGSSRKAADLCLLANLRSEHLTITRSGDAYCTTEPGQGEPTWLRDGSELQLDGRVKMRLRTPSVLSPTAVLSPAGAPWPRMFTPGKTPFSVDGIVMMDEVCLLGPAGDAHIVCLDWEEPVVLFRRNGQLWCRSRGEIAVDGRDETAACPLRDGSIVSGTGWRFRVEAAPNGGIRRG
jgi:hypothetical protein